MRFGAGPYKSLASSGSSLCIVVDITGLSVCQLRRKSLLDFQVCLLIFPQKESPRECRAVVTALTLVAFLEKHRHEHGNNYIKLAQPSVINPTCTVSHWCKRRLHFDLNKMTLDWDYQVEPHLYSIYKAPY